MKIVNLTPHAISIYNANKELVTTIQSSGIARIGTVKEIVGEIDNIPLFQTKVTGEPLGLPNKEEDTVYIVSTMFRSYYDREDLYQPGELLRDEKGNPVGCIGLSR